MAIPFLFALLIGILVIGGIAMVIYKSMNGEEELKQMAVSTTKPTAENNVTILFVLDEEDNSITPDTFLVARILPSEKKLLFLCFPSTMLSVANGKQSTIQDIYSNSGISALKTAITSESSIEIDKYIILDSDAFQKLCNMFGCVEYLVPTGLDGFSDSSVPQYLGASQIERLVCYPYFTSGESQRCALVADLFTEMLNQTDYDRLLTSMDSNFKALINMVDTDISLIEYNSEKSALSYLFTYGSEIAMYRMVTAEKSTSEVESTSDYFILSTGFYDTVVDYFSTEEGEK